MISVHDYTIAVLSTDPLLRAVLPQAMHILGQEQVSFFSSMYDAVYYLKKIKTPKIFLIDDAYSFEDLNLYQSNLFDALIFILSENKTRFVCSVDACLQSLGAAEKNMSDLRQKRLQYGHDTPEAPLQIQQILDPTLSEKAQYIFKAPNPPLEILTLYKIDKPITMRGVVSSLKAVLPPQKVATNAAAITYTLLENSLQERLEKYTSQVMR